MGTVDPEPVAGSAAASTRIRSQVTKRNANAKSNIVDKWDLIFNYQSFAKATNIKEKIAFNRC